MRAVYAELVKLEGKMGINGILADYYQAGYVNSKATKVEEGKSFAEVVE